jgi:predicted dithiol-disulfide oxidoreductase (DUF899 family)
MTPANTVHLPGESTEYRKARQQLLEAELELRRRTEAVATLRRGLPLGGEIPKDYAFQEGAADLSDATTVRSVRLSELFSPGKDTLVVYSFMYGPRMQQACPMCTSMLDGLDGQVIHATQRANVAVVAKSPIQRIREYARTRGWRNLRLLSSADNTYNADYLGETPDGAQMPALNVFVRRDGKVRHFYMTELLYAPAEPGQNGRHVDSIWPLWNLLDFTPEGRGTDWYPKISYGG